MAPGSWSQAFVIFRPHPTSWSGNRTSFARPRLTRPEDAAIHYRVRSRPGVILGTLRIT